MDNNHNAQVVTAELNMKTQFSTVKTISGSSMIRQHFSSPITETVYCLQSPVSSYQAQLLLLTFYKIL